MKQSPRQRFAAMSVLLLLLSGCAGVRMFPEKTDGSPVVRELIKTTRSWDGMPLPDYPQGQPEVTILRIIIPAGTRLHTHSHPVINAGVLISGRLDVFTLDGKTLHLKAGDPVVEVVDTWHYGVNRGKTPAEIIVFYTGVADLPITVAEPQ